MNAKVDKDKCIGCGACVATCSDNFRMNDENKAEVIHTNIPEELSEDTKNAANSCPVDAIIIEE